MTQRTLTFDDGCGFTVQSTLGDPTVRVVKLEGWWGGSEMEADLSDRLGDGAFPTRGRRKARTLTLGFKQFYETEEDLLRARRAVSGIFRSGELAKGSLTVSYAGVESLTAEQLGLASGSAPRTTMYRGAKMLDWEASLQTPDAHVYGPLQNLTIHTPDAGVGLRYPLYANGYLDYGVSVPSNPMPLRNDGNALAYPLLRVEGSFPAGFQIHLEGDVPSGSGVVWRGSLGETDVAEVDFYKGRVVVNGSDQSFALSQRKWGGVAAKGQLRPSIVPLGSGGGGWANVNLRSTYI